MTDRQITPEQQAALDRYWTAKTPEEESSAKAEFERLGIATEKAAEQTSSCKSIAAALQAYETLTIERLGDVREAVKTLNEALRRAASAGVHIPSLETEVSPSPSWNKELGQEVLQVLQPKAFAGYKL